MDPSNDCANIFPDFIKSERDLIFKEYETSARMANEISVLHEPSNEVFPIAWWNEQLDDIGRQSSFPITIRK